MDQDDLLLEVSQVLERLRIPYFVTGSIATIFYGEPRFTNDEESAFNRSRFARARKVRVKEDVDVEFASPEDVILMKLEYYRRGNSEKHLRDIAGVFAVSGDDLDWEYIAEWVAGLGLEETWAELDEREAP